MTRRMPFWFATLLALGSCCGFARAQTLAPHPVAPSVSAPVYEADTAYLEERINNLERELKKKQDKGSSKKNFSIKFNGRAFFDSYSVSQSGADIAGGAPERFHDLKNWNGLRDLRLGVAGEGFDIMDYKIDLSFVQATVNSNNAGVTGNSSGVNFKDVWLGVKNVPLFEYVRIGNYRVEDGVGALTAATNTTFMEFSGPSRDFAFSRRIGISSRQLWMDQRLRLFTGIFLLDDIAGARRYEQQDNQGIIVNARATYMPYISRGKDGKQDGRCFMMFGGNYSFVDNTQDKSISDVSRFAELQLGNVLNADVYAGQFHRFGIEAVVQEGPWALQSEWFARYYERAFVANRALSSRRDRTTWGGYIEVRRFLTGDFRKFSPEAAAWSGVSLKRDLDLRKVNDSNYACSLGAFELAAKWAYTDMSELWERGLATAPIVGDVHDFTIGLNWYWTHQARWMFHYSHVMPAQIRDGQGRDHSDTDIFAVAFRFHF